MPLLFQRPDFKINMMEFPALLFPLPGRWNRGGISRNHRGSAKKEVAASDGSTGDDSIRMKWMCLKAAIVDGEIIKADTWYKLVNGEFAEVDNE